MTTIYELLREDKQSDKEIHALIRSWRQPYKDYAKYLKTTFGNYEITPNGIHHKGKILYIFPFMLNEQGELPIKFWR